MECIEFYCSLRDEYSAGLWRWLSVINTVISSGRYFQGDQVDKLELQITAMTGRMYGSAVGSGTDALYFAIRSLNLPENRNHILVPNYSFIATASAILRAGCVPVFVDVDRDYTMDLDKAEKLVDEHVGAMIFVPLFGRVPDMVPIEDFADRYRLFLIEDAAQAFGAWDPGYGRPAGSLGHVSCLSFDATKTLGSPMGGGMVLTDLGDIQRSVQDMRYHGRKSGYQVVGMNSQMSELGAALLNYRLETYGDFLDRHTGVALKYIEGLGSFPEIHCPIPTVNHIFSKFVLRCPTNGYRDALKQFLAAKGISTMVHYPQPLSDLPVFGLGDTVDCGVARLLSALSLSLPIYPHVDTGRVLDGISAFRQEFGGLYGYS